MAPLCTRFAGSGLPFAYQGLGQRAPPGSNSLRTRSGSPPFCLLGARSEGYSRISFSADSAAITWVRHRRFGASFGALAQDPWVLAEYPATGKSSPVQLRQCALRLFGVGSQCAVQGPRALWCHAWDSPLHGSPLKEETAQSEAVKAAETTQARPLKSASGGLVRGFKPPVAPPRRPMILFPLPCSGQRFECPFTSPVAPSSEHLAQGI